jgi:hypothetical protein
MSMPSIPKSSRLIGYQEYALLGNTQVTSQDSKVDVALDQISDNSTASLNASTSAIADGPTYPLNVYSPLVPNPVPLTEITIMACFPLLLQKCKPLTTVEKDARLGPWVRIDRPLDPDTAQSRSQESGGGIFDKLGTGGWFNKLMGSFEAKYIFYRRSRRSDVPKVIDLKLVETGSDKKPSVGDFAGWHRIKMDLKSSFFRVSQKSASMHLYYRTTGGTAEDRIGEETVASAGGEEESTGESLEPITELDITVSWMNGWDVKYFECIGLNSSSF